jgi:hypothetical protein
MQDLVTPIQSPASEGAAAPGELTADQQIEGLLRGTIKPEDVRVRAKKEPEKVEAAPGGDTEQGAETVDPEKGEKAESEGAPDPEKDAKPEIDYKQKIPLADGKTATLGELKDAFQAQETARAEVIAQRTEVAAARLQLGQIMQHLKALPPEVVHMAEQQAERDYRQNRQNLEMVLPQTASKTGAAEITDRLVRGLERFGVTRDDIAGVSDYRLVWAFNTLLEQSEAVASARERLKPNRPSDPRAAGKPPAMDDTRSKVQRALQTRNRNDGDAAIMALLTPH